MCYRLNITTDVAGEFAEMTREVSAVSTVVCDLEDQATHIEA